VGSSLAIIIRWQHAYAGQALPVIGLLGEVNVPTGVISPEFDNQLGAMHGAIMVSPGIVPLAFGAFGNYVMPLQISGRTWRSCGRTSCSTALPGRFAQLLRDRRRNAQRLDLVCTMSDIAPGHGQTLWLVGMLPLVHTTSTKCQ
jgi:cytochrome c oxidase subunit 1